MKRRKDYAPRKSRRRVVNPFAWGSSGAKPCPKCGGALSLQPAAEGSFYCCSACGYTRKHPGRGSP